MFRVGPRGPTDNGLSLTVEEYVMNETQKKTTGQMALYIATRTGQYVNETHIRRAANKSLIPHTRIGMMRLFDVADADAIIVGLQKLGCIKPQLEAAANG